MFSAEEFSSEANTAVVEVVVVTDFGEVAAVKGIKLGWTRLVGVKDLLLVVRVLRLRREEEMREEDDDDEEEEETTNPQTEYEINDNRTTPPAIMAICRCRGVDVLLIILILLGILVSVLLSGMNTWNVRDRANIIFLSRKI